ncbi:MAG: hypothetical protein ACF8QF_01920 [Phycisphaerales bacterium]
MSFRETVEKHQEVVGAITGAHREAAVWLPFGALEIASVFSEAEAREAQALVERLRAARDDDERVVLLAESARVALGLLRLARAW